MVSSKAAATAPSKVVAAKSTPVNTKGGKASVSRAAAGKALVAPAKPASTAVAKGGTKDARIEVTARPVTGNKGAASSPAVDTPKATKGGKVVPGKPSLVVRTPENAKLYPSKPATTKLPAPAAPLNARPPAPIIPAYVRPVPQAPVPTDLKPRKNQIGLNVRELEHFRELLLAKRRELVGDMSSMEREALRGTSGSNLSNLPVHMADMGTDNYEQEFTLGLVEKDRQLLREINQALAKIQDGTYGVCEGTGKPIGRPRLEAQPWARYSIEHARSLEKNMLRR